MKYPSDMDPECVRLCDAINSIPGLSTGSSCCGHGKGAFRVYFRVEDLTYLPILLYYMDPCHVGFRWDCLVRTDCSMAPVGFHVESRSMGADAYREADIIAGKISSDLEKHIKHVKAEQ